jgi:hypothetical protein
MSEQENIPLRCYELLEHVHRRGRPVPYRSLPFHLQDVGLLKVCHCHKLIELELWYEPGRKPGVSSSRNILVVESPPEWLPFYQTGHESIEQAIDWDAGCDDPRKGLHVALTPKGDLTHEMRRLSKGNGEGNGDVDGGQGGSASDLAELLASLKPSHRRACLQRLYAQRHCPGLDSDQPGDEGAHKWLMEIRDEEGKKPVAYETWIRYLRAARRALGGPNPRRTRDHGSSIVRVDQV